MNARKVIAIPIVVVGTAVIMGPLAIYALLVCGSARGVRYYYG